MVLGGLKSHTYKTHNHDFFANFVVVFTAAKKLFRHTII
jgi:hypothetical protein